MFCSSHFLFFVFGHFWRQSYKNTKILRNLCLHFARQDGQVRKKWKENCATKVTKIPKSKRQKHGLNKTISFPILLVNLLNFTKILREAIQSRFSKSLPLFQTVKAS